MNPISPMKTVVLALAGICLLAVWSSAGAAIIDVRVDFNDTATTPVGWNCIPNPTDTATVFNLTDFNTGLASGATLRVTKAFSTDSGTNVAVVWSNPYAPWVDVLALRDYAVLTGTGTLTAQVTLAGLDPGSAYRVELLAVRNNPTSNTSYLVNGVAGAGPVTGQSSTLWNEQTYGFTGQDFMLWSSVIADANGKIIIDVSSVGDYAFFNGLRLYAVPEPSSLAICLGLFGGGLGLASRWRRGRNPRDRVPRSIQHL